MDEMIKFDAPKKESSIIKVLGVGGGGSNAVNHMFNQGINGVDFIVCNTDGQSLDKSPVPIKIQLGSGGLGAGSKPVVGKEAAQESLEEIRAFLENDTKMLFVTAGMGGGTGTGAAPVIAELARELDILTVGIVTIPFQFEGKRRRQQADEGIEELRRNVDTLLTISNDKLREAFGNLKLTDAFAKADDVLTVAAKGIAEIITVSGIINVDFEDVKTVMKESGQAIMGSAVYSGEDRALNAISEAMASPLLDDNNISGAENILLYIASAEDHEISMDEVSEITEYIQNESGNSADVIWGNGHDNSLGDAISVTLIATGFSNKGIPRSLDADEKKVNDLYQAAKNEASAPPPAPAPTYQAPSSEPMVQNIPPAPIPNVEPIFSSHMTPAAENSPQRKVYQLDGEIQSKVEEKTFKPTNNSSFGEQSNFNLDQNESFYNTSRNGDANVPTNQQEAKIEEEPEAEDLTRRRLKDISLKLVRNLDNLESLEKEPAYLRRNVELTDTNPSKDQKISRYTMTSDGDRNPEIRSNNHFLHDNVD